MDFELEMRGNIERIEVLMEGWSEDEARCMHEFDNNPECFLGVPLRQNCFAWSLR